MLFARLLEHVIRRGRMRLVDASGREYLFDRAAGPLARHADLATGADGLLTVRLRDPALHWKLFLRPRLHIGDAYMDGTLTVENGTFHDFLDLLIANVAALPAGFLARHVNGVRVARLVSQYNPLSRAKRNVAHHYDLSDALYALFLDRDRQYSCAYFPSSDTDLDAAQLAKKRHIAAKLLLRPGMRVLDIGCGWGGMALYLARECGVEVTGLTLSTEQHRVAERRAAEAGLSDRVRFHLRDYRQETGRYDRIVSVGMFEHVGIAHYAEFFARLKQLLGPRGVALVHAIGRMSGPGQTNPWLRKYIFPGGYSPALSEVLPHAERQRLWITDIEILRLHYAETLRAWRQRFEQNRSRIAALYDERFCRMWEVYLAGSEIAFRRQGHMVFQMQISTEIDTVPLTRDYVADWEREHKEEVAARGSDASTDRAA